MPPFMSKLTAAQVGPIGAWLDSEGSVRFRQWAPEHRTLEVVLYDDRGHETRALEMQSEPNGFFSAQLEDGRSGLLYKFRIDGEGPFPDPWARAQPLGVHGPSQVISTAFPWSDRGWPGLPADGLVIYELHVGTATPDGTFEALIPKLDELRSLGITALELMPLASFPGRRNWGYDGVSLFAPQHSYGGPDGLRRLVDAAHARGLAVLMDAVYNHFGPDGNYLRCYASHYFTGRHHTPWGEGVNYDGESSAVVRELALRNAEMWIRDYHADGLRLDAVHAILDDSEVPLIQELQLRARAAAPERKIVIIAEDERNEPRLVTPVDQGGWGLDAQWADDFHHQLRRAFAGDTDGYYGDYSGSAADIATTLRKGWFYEGQTSPSRGQPRGKPADDLEAWRFVLCIENHDQVGNRATGNRLEHDVSPAAFRAMSTLLLLSPYTPLLFMGQEWNASTPFQYFTDHPEALGRAVTEGRRKEFDAFARFAAEEVPDPQAPETFERSKLDWAQRERPPHAGVYALYRELLRLRREDPRLLEHTRGSWDAEPVGEAVRLVRRGPDSSLCVFVNVRGKLAYELERDAQMLLWSEEPRFGGALTSAPIHQGKLVLEGPQAAVYGFKQALSPR
ncbi:MAG: malto-oligosyltrehalose trehalohydrolase [Myxococcaceae bacterium]